MTKKLLKDSNNFNEYQLLFDQVPCSVLLIDRNFRIIKANTFAKDKVGNVKGKYCFEALKKEKKECAECTAKLTFLDSKKHSGYHVWKSKNNNPIHMHLVSVPVHFNPKNNEVTTVMEIAVDVSNTLKLQSNLKKTNNYLHSIIQTSSDAILTVNNKGKVKILNDKGYNLFETKKNRIISIEDFLCLMPKGLLAKISDIKNTLLSKEIKIKTFKGKKVPVMLSVSPLKINQSKNNGYSFVLQDLREKKKLEEKSLELELIRIVSETTSGIAHCVKNIAIALEGGVYLLKSGFIKNKIKRIEEGFEVLSRNTSRLSEVIKKFLLFSKKTKYVPEKIMIKKLIQNVINSYREKADKNNIDLLNKCSDDSLYFYFNYNQIYECLSNLIDNSIDSFSNKSYSKKNYVIINAADIDSKICFEIKDNGSGIDTDSKKNIFTKLFTTKGLKGSGLGLILTRKIVTENKGNINFSSTLGKGSIFQLKFKKKIK